MQQKSSYLFRRNHVPGYPQLAQNAPSLSPSWVLLYLRARVSIGAKGAWHPPKFLTILCGTRRFWQSYHTMFCSSLKLDDLLVIGARFFEFLTQASCLKRKSESEIYRVFYSSQILLWRYHLWNFKFGFTKLYDSFSKREMLQI